MISICGRMLRKSLVGAEPPMIPLYQLTDAAFHGGLGILWAERRGYRVPSQAEIPETTSAYERFEADVLCPPSYAIYCRRDEKYGIKPEE